MKDRNFTSAALVMKRGSLSSLQGATSWAMQVEASKRETTFNHSITPAHHSFGTEESLVVYTSKSKVPAGFPQILIYCPLTLRWVSCAVTRAFARQLTWIGEEGKEGDACSNLQHVLVSMSCLSKLTTAPGLENHAHKSVQASHLTNDGLDFS